MTVQFPGLVHTFQRFLITSGHPTCKSNVTTCINSMKEQYIHIIELLFNVFPHVVEILVVRKTNQ